MDIPTAMHENNVAFIAQIKGGYIEVDRTNYISNKVLLYS